MSPTELGRGDSWAYYLCQFYP